MREIEHLIRLQNWVAAEARIAQALRKHPVDGQLLFCLGYVLAQQGKSASAIQALRRCLGANPGNTQAMTNLCMLLIQVGEPEQAIPYAQKIVRNAPTEGINHYILSVAWLHCRNPGNSLEAVTHALTFRPGVVEWMRHKMAIRAQQGDFHEAQLEACAIINLPGHADDLESWLTLVNSCAELSRWAQIESAGPNLERCLQAPSAFTIASGLMMQFDHPEMLYRVGKHPVDLPSGQKKLKSSSIEDRRIVLGFLSADIREHPVAQMLSQVLPLHDRTRFELVLLRLAPSGDSSIGIEVSAMFDREIDLTQGSDGAAADLIRRTGIDILIDLMGATSGARLGIVEKRPCAVQLLWLGCPVTTGRSHYDGFIVDEIVAPIGYERYCTEPLIRLPACYHPICVGSITDPPSEQRASLGVPDNAMLIGLLQQPNRIRPEFLQMVCRVLAPREQTYLALRVRPDAQKDAILQLENLGISRHRIVFINRRPSRSDYLGVIRAVDLLVDSHPYGGHSTTGEALFLGKPVLARAGACIHARVAASMMHELGLFDLVVHSAEEHEKMLGRLIDEPALFKNWSERFGFSAKLPSRQRHQRLIRELEDTYTRALVSMEIQ